MTTYSDNLLAARFAALAPEPLAGDWVDVVERAGTSRKDQARLSRPFGRRRRLVAVLALVALVMVVTASAIGGVRELILDRGFLGLAPEGATPSTPESGELVLHYLGRSAAHAKGRFVAPLVQVWVYADGRVIWSEESSGSSKPVLEGASEGVTGYLEQRLTPDGVDFLQSEITRFFDRTSGAVETLPSNYDPMSPSNTLALFIADPGVPWGGVELRDGDGFLGLHWVARGDHSPNLEGPTATPEQVADVLRIDALLTDRESVLPTSAWAVRKIRAYVPSHYAVCFRSSPVPRDESQLLSLLPTRAAGLLRDKSRTRVEGDIQVNSDNGPLGVGDRWAEYCSKVRTEEAREVAKALSGLDPAPHLARLEYPLAKGEDWWEGTSIYFEPYFPDGQVTCSVCG